MNLRKFISGVSAFAIAASAFAGIAVTASAATNVNVDSITSSTNTWTEPDGDSSGEYKFVYEADVLIQDGAKLTISYYGGNNNKGFPKALGPGYVFDATSSDGYVTVNNQNGTVNINSNPPYSKYHTGYTAHIRIVTDQVTKTGSALSDYLGNSTITFSFDTEDAYKQGSTKRFPSQNRTVTNRNLNGDAENEHVRAVSQTIEGDVTLSNVHIYREKIPADFDVAMSDGTAVNGTGNYANDVATWYVATVTNNGGSGSFDSMTVSNGTDTDTTDLTEITLAMGAYVYVGVIIDGGDYSSDNITATVE